MAWNYKENWYVKFEGIVDLKFSHHFSPTVSLLLFIRAIRQRDDKTFLHAEDEK